MDRAIEVSLVQKILRGSGGDKFVHGVERFRPSIQMRVGNPQVSPNVWIVGRAGQLIFSTP